MDRQSTLGRRIAEARKAAGLTQADLAARMAVTPQAVSGWERDEARPDVDKLDSLARALDTSLMQLLQDAGNAAQTYLEELAERSYLGRAAQRRPRKFHIREWREHSEMEASDVANALSIDDATYGFLETYPHKFTIEQIEQIAAKLKISFDHMRFPPPGKDPGEQKAIRLVTKKAKKSA